jgi:chromosome segregation ATPase
MSEITDAKTSLKEIISTIEEMKSLSADSLPKLNEHPTKLLELIEQFEEEKNNNVKTIEANTDETNSLKSKMAQDNRDIVRLGEENTELTKQRQELLDKISKLQQELADTQEKIKGKKEDLNTRGKRLEELKTNVQKLTAIQDDFDEKMKKIETELKTDFDKKDKFARSYINRVAAMKALIKSKYISSQLLQFILSLQKDASLDLKNILVAIDMREDTAKTILKKIIELNGPVEYDKSAGTVTLNGEVDFL